MTEDEFELFRNQMHGVRRIKAPQQVDNSRPSQDQSLNQYRRYAASQEIVQDKSELTDAHVELVGSDTPLLFCTPGVQLNLFKRLRQGRLAWEAGLDLHGFKIEQAREELEHFTRDALRMDMRVVLVVHGKAVSDMGKFPLLKSHTNDWLRQMPAVLAYCSALPKDGGNGALYVLLKKGRQR